MALKNRSDRTLGNGQLKRLQNKIDEFYELLDVTGEWRVRDVPIHSGTIQILKREGAVEQVEKVYVDGGKTTVHTYRWHEPAKEALKDYWEDRTNLPCGHKAHVRHHPDKDCLTCKDCQANGELPEYSKELVSELL